MSARLDPQIDSIASDRGVPALFHVNHVEDLSSWLRRIHFTGADVASFFAHPRTPNIKLLFPPDAAAQGLPNHAPLAPPPLIAGTHRWDLSPMMRSCVRTYTVRKVWRDDDGLAYGVDIDFVLHGDEGLAGPWAQRAHHGDRLIALGGGGKLPPTDRPLLMFADETGVPAVVDILERAPRSLRAHVGIEVSPHASPCALPAPAHVDVTWIERDSSQAYGSALQPWAYTQLTSHPSRSILPADPNDGGTYAHERPFVWAAAESGTIRFLRPLLRSLGYGRSDQLLIGYWHHGITETHYAMSCDHDRDKAEAT